MNRLHLASIMAAFFLFSPAVHADRVDDALSTFWSSLGEWQKEHKDQQLDAFSSQEEGYYQFGRLQQAVPPLPSYPNGYGFKARALPSLDKLPTDAYSYKDNFAAGPASGARPNNSIDYLGITPPSFSNGINIKRGNPNSGILRVPSGASASETDILRMLNYNREMNYRLARRQANLMSGLNQQQIYMLEYQSLRESSATSISQYESARKLLCVEMALAISSKNSTSKKIFGAFIIPENSYPVTTLEEAFILCTEGGQPRSGRVISSDIVFNRMIAAARDPSLVSGSFTVDPWLTTAAKRFPYDMNLAWDLFTRRWEELVSDPVYVNAGFINPLGVDTTNFANNYWLAEFLMTVTGTVIFSWESNQVKFTAIPGRGVTDAVMDRLVFGKQSGQFSLSCANDKCLDVSVDIGGNAKPASTINLYQQVLDDLHLLDNPAVDNSTLDDSQNFVNRTYLPVKRILATFSSLPKEQRDAERQKLAEIIATEYAIDFVENTVKIAIERAQSQLVSELEIVTEWQRNLEQILAQIQQRRQELHNRLISGLQYVQFVQKREQNTELLSPLQHVTVNRIIQLTGASGQIQGSR